MNKVYILQTDNFIKGVYASKEQAFNAISADTMTQSLRTDDGEEEIIPTPETVVLNCNIYAHYNSYTNELINFTSQAEDRIYKITEHIVKK